MKRSILFVYPTMMIGGSTSALLGILNSIDYNVYDVDLILNDNGGPMYNYIPEQVNVLPCAVLTMGKPQKMLRMLAQGFIEKGLLDSIRYKRKIGFVGQNLAYAKNAYCRKLEKHYDVAVGGLEGWANAYVNEMVDAEVKISWIHTDYRRMKYIPEVDEWSLNKSNYVVCVSEILAAQLREIMPTIARKIVSMNNIISPQMIKRMAEEKIDEESAFTNDDFKILTVARLTFAQKRFDRAVNALAELRKKGLNVSWYIVGDGPDKEAIIQMAVDKGVRQYLHVLGAKTNPYPYYKLVDLFALTSDVEGTPVTVCESQILGTPVLVTRYESAHMQIHDGVDGIIAENNEESLVKELEKVIAAPQTIEKMRAELQQRANLESSVVQMKQFEMMCNGEYDGTQK